MESEAVLNFSKFPLEIIAEILSRVPVKFVLRLKCVSKFWLSLISSPHFIKMHLNLSANNQDSHRLLILDELLYQDKWLYRECPVTSLFVESAIQAVDLDYYPFDDHRHEFYMRGLCNGLVLLASESHESPIGYPILWNPTMRKYKKLSDFRPKFKQCFPIYGFGYDELHDDYKVVAIMYHEDVDYCIDDSEIQVYSLKSDSWTSVDYSGEWLFMKNGAGTYDEVLDFSRVSADGKIYWNSFPSNMPRVRNIISFDIANEKWDKMGKPSFVVGESGWYVDRLGSDLCVITDYNGTHSDVWVMNKYGVETSWIRKHVIRYPTSVRWRSPYFISSKGQVLLQKDPCAFMIYDSKDDSLRHIRITNLQGNHDMIIYSESLVSPF